MALINLTDFEQLIVSYIPLVGSALDFQREKQVQKALVALYDQSDALAVLLVKDIAAFLWWAYHVGSAAADSLGYSAQIQAALKKANANNEAIWNEWLDVKYPDDLKALYKFITDEQNGKAAAQAKKLASELAKLAKEIAALETWKNKTVDPTLTEWKQFYDGWKKTYLPLMRLLSKWESSPKALASYVLPPLMPELASALHKQTYQGTATSIEQALVNTWVNDPQDIFTGMLQWLVSS